MGGRCILEFIEKNVTVGLPDHVSGIAIGFQNFQGEWDEVIESYLFILNLVIRIQSIIGGKRILPGQIGAIIVDNPFRECMECEAIKLSRKLTSRTSTHSLTEVSGSINLK